MLFNDEEFKGRLAAARSAKELFKLHAEVLEGCERWCSELASHTYANAEVALPDLGAAVLEDPWGEVGPGAPPADLTPLLEMARDGEDVGPLAGGHALADAFSQVERHERRVSRVYMSPTDFSDIRKFCRDVFDFESRLDRVQAGNLGSVFGAPVTVSREVPAGFLVLHSAETMDKGELTLKIRLGASSS